MKSVDDLISEYVLGTLPNEERRQVDLMVAESSHLRREADATGEALALGMAQGLPPLAVPRALRDRLMATLSSPDRFAPFMPALSKLFELPADTIRGLLARADTSGAFWESWLGEQDLPGIELFHFPVGPTLAADGAAGGVLRLRPGATFPRHTHGGDETNFILEGAMQVDNQLAGPGTMIAVAKGASHEYSASPERSLLIMVLHRGITFGDSSSIRGSSGT